MSAAWLTYPLALDSSRAFDCEGFTPEQCSYYSYRWHFWYNADLVFALPTVAFFMCAIGIFIIGHFTTRLLSLHRGHGPPTWRRLIAGLRYLSYRGFHIKAFQWNSAPVGLLLLVAAGVVFFFCMDLAPKPYYWPSLDWGNSPPLATRSGWMALACMPFVFATASKTNWITLLTGVSHEKLQMFHRWISYAFFLLALMHTFPFIVYHIRSHNMVEQVTESATLFYWTGIVALIFQAWLTFASASAFRGVGYEFFKAAHFFSVVIFVIVFFWHCDYTLTSWDYFVATAAVYVPCWLYPWLRTCFEYGIGQKAEVFVEDNGFVRLKIPANFEWVPGQHCFLRFRNFGIHALTTHPFTICSLPSLSSNEPSHLVFYIRHRSGFTARLQRYAMKQPGALVPVLVDGPYGGIDPHKLVSNDRLLIIAGGSGAGWILPFIEQTARCNLARDSAASIEDDPESDFEKPSRNTEQRLPLSANRSLSLRVILATRDASTRIWFRKTITDLLSKYPTLSQSSELEIQIYLTGEADQLTDSSKSLIDFERSKPPIEAEHPVVGLSEGEGTLNKPDPFVRHELHGRPELPLVVREEASDLAETGRSLGVFVCGPDTMQNDVRNAVAKENLNILKGSRCGGIYLHTEHFSWA